MQGRVRKSYSFVKHGAAGDIRFGRVLHLGSWIGFYEGSFPNAKANANAPTLNVPLRY
ncbi:hypothetical protein GCM10007362_36340 [Saccharibacillus endophyticus]|uniref:Uncharacterized protein n=1 Tax=Saccharibacillus endophyticus TaxID=2060666 RepID=A0ABQ2A2F6_9BACL|nr:hypothetical protein GCM10007362_36340 [Saccharibacillus endophyticus]